MSPAQDHFLFLEYYSFYYVFVLPFWRSTRWYELNLRKIGKATLKNIKKLDTLKNYYKSKLDTLNKIKPEAYYKGVHYTQIPLYQIHYTLLSKINQENI